MPNSSTSAGDALTDAKARYTGLEIELEAAQVECEDVQYKLFAPEEMLEHFEDPSKETTGELEDGKLTADH
eukprot:7703693-Pyramimonas_sp.AAC.1